MHTGISKAASACKACFIVESSEYYRQYRSTAFTFSLPEIDDIEIKKLKNRLDVRLAKRTSSGTVHPTRRAVARFG